MFPKSCRRWRRRRISCWGYRGRGGVVIKQFNVNGACRPDRHYMVELGSRLEEIRKMIDDGAYFSINRARQYGKTTILRALAEYLKKDYFVLSLDFQRILFCSWACKRNSPQNKDRKRYCRRNKGRVC